MGSAELLSYPAIAAPVLVLAFLFGAVFGSFIACVAYRLAEGESPWGGRSHCDSCGHVLTALDLVPVASWLLLGGKCRHCGAKVPVSCIVAELLTALYFVSMVVAFGLTVKAIALCALGVILLGLSLVDFRTFIIPNGFIIAGIVVWVAYVAVLFALGDPAAMNVLIDGLVGGFAIAGAVLLLSLIFDKILGKQSMGGGDIKLLFVVGLFLGGACSLLNLIIACVVGLAFALGRGNRGAQASDVQLEEGELPLDAKAFPFGPSIAAATWFSLLFGPALVGLYLSLFL